MGKISAVKAENYFISLICENYFLKMYFPFLYETHVKKNTNNIMFQTCLIIFFSILGTKSYVYKS